MGPIYLMMPVVGWVRFGINTCKKRGIFKVRQQDGYLWYIAQARINPKHKKKHRKHITPIGFFRTPFGGKIGKFPEKKHNKKNRTTSFPGEEGGGVPMTTTFPADALSGGSLQSGQPGEFTGSRTHGTGWSNGEEGGGGFWNGAKSPDAPDAGDLVLYVLVFAKSLKSLN